jgi:hypothetical protein
MSDTEHKIQDTHRFISVIPASNDITSTSKVKKKKKCKRKNEKRRKIIHILNLAYRATTM